MTDLGLYTNRNSKSDFVQNTFTIHGGSPCNVYIAVAFFTDSSVIETLVTNGCTVKLIVRLGFPTSAAALSNVMKIPGIEIRYFTDRSFHSKLYVFGTHSALVGSANLTKAATMTNQEVVVEIGSDDARLPELANLFNEYWNDAKVLTPEDLQHYEKICQKFADLWNQEYKHGSEILGKLGRVVSNNIARGLKKETRENLFLEDFRKTYQECVGAFNQIRKIYERYGHRKVKSESIPLRLEIDSFISFVRERHAIGDTWLETPIISGVAREKFIEERVITWHQTPWPYFEETIVKDHYPWIIKVFESPDTIRQADDDDLFDALCVVHSFYDRLRFFEGGMPTWKKAFLVANDPKHTRDSLSYLLFGQDKIEVRMANLIYSSTYKLNEFGQSNVQELVGWINKENLPVINGRTTKVLRYFGFDVRQM